MCGICGYFAKRAQDRGFSFEFASRNIPAIEPRGPDFSKMISLPKHHGFIAMCSLSINNPKENFGPYASQGLRYYISYNGEIYNHLELASAFGLEILDNENDAHIILKLFEKKGPSGFSYLNGMFALAIFDTQKNRLHLVLDRFGQKSLYWHNSQQGFGFSSVFTEVGWLYRKPPIPHEFWCFQDFTDGTTPKEGVYKLLGGQHLTYDLSSDNISLTDIQTSSFTPVEVNFGKFFTEVVNRHVPDQNFGVLLSGGLDSALIAAVSKPSVAITVSFDEHDAYREEHKASEFCRVFEIEHIILKPRRKDFVKYFNDLSKRLQYPVGNASIFPEYVVYKELAQRGIRVCISGLGADELFLGYERMRLFIFEVIGRSYVFSKNYNPLKAKVDSVLSQNHSLPYAYLLLLARVPINEIEKLPEISLPDKISLGRMMTLLELKYSLPALLRTTDALSGSFGIEVRAPFLDNEIADYALSLGDDEKISCEKGTKVPLRELAKTLNIPSSIVADKTKRGFAAPYGFWMNDGNFAHQFDRLPLVKTLVESFLNITHKAVA